MWHNVNVGMSYCYLSQWQFPANQISVYMRERDCSTRRPFSRMPTASPDNMDYIVNKSENLLFPNAILVTVRHIEVGCALVG